jgi:hypothetical protein
MVVGLVDAAGLRAFWVTDRRSSTPAPLRKRIARAGRLPDNRCHSCSPTSISGC